MQLTYSLQFFSPSIPQFSKCTPQHYTYNDLRALFRDDFFKYVFTIVRDPYARVESEYRMRWLISKGRDEGAYPEFSQWLELRLDIVRRNKHAYDHHLRLQVDFLGSRVKVFRFEDGLNTILRQVSEDTGLPFDGTIGHFRSTSAFRGTIDWDMQDRVQINRFYAEDFVHLKYDMIT